ncbi:MAG: hypothetical protein ACLQVL_27690 [Terriglobia bacterium]
MVTKPNRSNRNGRRQRQTAIIHPPGWESVKKSQIGRFLLQHVIENPSMGMPWRARTSGENGVRMPFFPGAVFPLTPFFRRSFPTWSKT